MSCVLNAKGVSFEVSRRSHTQISTEADAGVGCAVCCSIAEAVTPQAIVALVAGQGID